MTYLDEELRVSRGDKGNIFVLRMVGGAGCLGCVAHLFAPCLALYSFVWPEEVVCTWRAARAPSLASRAFMLPAG